MNLPKIIDNQRRSLKDVLISAIKANDFNFNEISIATGYWDLGATSLIFPYLKNYKKIRLLIGKEPLLPRYNSNNIEVDYPEKDFFLDLQNTLPTEELKQTVRDLKDLYDKGVIEVKVYKKNFLHAKCYIFGNLDSRNAIGIIGSSNFTKNGITTNTELNSLEQDVRVVMFQPTNDSQEVGHLFWFNNLWNDKLCEDWSGKFIELVTSSNHGEKIFSPYEMYIHSLYQIYKEELENPIDISKDSEDVLHSFQIRNAELLLKKLNKNGLAMLADSVGLGKTITAGSIIKKYIFDLGLKKPRVEVVVPSSLKTQWTQELSHHYSLIEGIDNFNITSYHNSDEIQKRQELDKHRSVDLFVIDEAHNLRNESSEKYNLLMQWIRNNDECHVLLLTATPINNQLSDFARQINLAGGGKEDLFYIQIPRIGNQQQTIKEHYDAIRDLDSEINRANNLGNPVDKNKISLIMRPILQHFMVRSTRVGIENEFGGIKNKNGELIKFPKAISKEERYQFDSDDRTFEINIDSDLKNIINKILKKDVESLIDNKQISKHPLDFLDEIEDLDKNQKKNTIYKVFLLTSFLGLPIYRISLYKNEFYDKTIDEISEMLKGKKKKEKAEVKLQMTIHNMMRILFLKRTESSLYSLNESLKNYLRRLNRFEEILDRNNKFIKISDLNEYYEAINNDNVENENKSEIIEVEADPKIFNIKNLKEDIAKDRDLLNILFKILEQIIVKDEKSLHLENLLKSINQENDRNKILIFSYYSDTVEFLENRLKKLEFINDDNSGFTNNKSKKDIENLANRFSPISKKYSLREGETEINFLVSTDVLSEGQNLQDCCILINYDLHWNPVRMIQRNGRINRLGSNFEEVFIYNLCPANEIEEYLKLEIRLKNKIEIIKHSIGTDQSILGEEANAIEFNEDDKILNFTKRIYEEGSDLNNIIKEFENETDLLSTEDQYISELRKFHNSENEEVKHRIYHMIPNGKWGYLPAGKKNENFDVLVHSTIKIDTLGKRQQLPLFVGLSNSGSIVYVDKLQALKTMQTSSNITYKQFSDFKNIDKIKINDTLDARLFQIAEQSFKKPTYYIKRHQEEILDYLIKKGMSKVSLISKVLIEHRNRDDRRFFTKRLRTLYEQMRDNQQVAQEIVNDLIVKSENILSKMTIASDAPKIVEDPEVYSYHVKDE